MLPASLRYVVLRHEGIGDPHFDLMFETSPGSALLTWRSPEWPPRPGLMLTKLGDHRRAYLDYEGPVSNNRGHVRRVAAGTLRILVTADAVFQVRTDSAAEMIFTRLDGAVWRCA